MKKIVQFLAVLTLLAVSTKVSAQVPCPAPTGLSTIIVDTNAVVTWNGTADAYLVKYRPLGYYVRWVSDELTMTQKLMVK